MRIRKVVAAAVAVAALLSLTACKGDSPTPIPTDPVVTELPDGESDCDIGDIFSGDEDCGLLNG